MTLPPLALFVHEPWAGPCQLPPIGFYLDTCEFTEETKANMLAEMVRRVASGESVGKASKEVSREIDRQLEECFSKMNRMLHTGSYEETA
jgi:protein-arginine kinase activator protein McsA